MPRLRRDRRADRTSQQVIAAVEDQIQRLQDAPPPEDEVRRAVKQARALFAYGSESITNQACWLGFSEMFADYSWFSDYLDNLEAITAQDVQRAAQKYLRPQQRIVGEYIPTGAALEDLEEVESEAWEDEA